MKRSLVVAGATLAASAVSLHAQGSAVQTHSSCATAMAAAGVASPCVDGSAVLFNPAALAMQPSVVGVGVTGIRTSGDFTYDLTGETVERDAATSAVPFGFASVRVNDRLAVGMGAFAPYGLRVQWPLDFEGRYVTYDTDFRNIYIQPTVALRVSPWFSLGGGLDIVRSSLTINQALDLADLTVTDPTGAPVLNPLTRQPLRFGNFGVPAGTDFARARLEGDKTAYTWHVAMLADLSERLSVGFRYLHSVQLNYDDGTATFEQVNTNLVLPPGNPLNPATPVPLDNVLQAAFAGPLADQSISTDLKLPNQAVFGIAFRPSERAKLLADLQYTGWHVFDRAPIDFGKAPDTDLILDYKDAYTVRLGGQLGVTDALDLRAGFIYNTPAERDAAVSPLLPEAERNYYSAGLGYRIGRGLGLDVAYQYVNQADRRGRVRGRTSFRQTADQLNAGLYHINASVFNATISYVFGPRR